MSLEKKRVCLPALEVQIQCFYIANGKVEGLANVMSGFRDFEGLKLSMVQMGLPIQDGKFEIARKLQS